MKRRRRRFKNQYSGAADNTPYLVMLPVVCALGALLFAVVLGLLLDRTVKRDDGGVEIPDEYKNVISHPFEGEVLKTASLYCFAVSTDNIKNSNFGFLDDMIQNGYDSVSFNLKNADGSITFISEAEKTMSSDVAAAGRYDLSNAVAVFREKGIKTCGIFYCRSHNYTGVTRIAQEALEVSVITEAGICGVDEILLMGLPTDYSSSDKIFNFVSDASRKTVAVVNVAVPYTAFSNEDIGEYLTYLSRCCDGLSIDLTGFDNDPNNASKICEYLDSINIIYYLERYNIRILLPSSLADLCPILKAAGYYNIGFIN